jgi:predicted metalloprotease with PDZ domain
MTKKAMWAVLVVALAVSRAAAQEIQYRVTFPEPEHRWMQVEVSFAGVTPPLELRMSRSSPGRYALHEFAKNVYDVRATDASGRALAVSRQDPYGWTVPAFDGDVRVTYRIYGERVDGTYLAIDTTHAHMNMPASFMWARGLADRPIRITFVPPPGRRWTAATQLFATEDAFTFTAPNLQYFLDSPTELAPLSRHSFTVPQPGGSGSATFRIALHHEGTESQAKMYAAAVEKIAAEQGAIFGEFPRFDPGAYTFIADYLPYASGDGMEHRNSTVLTGARSLGDPAGMRGALGTVSHELFHAWNVERIRPATLEPFDFERANMSGELWLAEGVTSYYGPLTMMRAELIGLDEFAQGLGGAVDAIVNGPGRQVRSAVEMSEMAAFVDAARAVDETNFDIAHISYYTWGAGIGLALDLSLRQRTNGRVTLDDFMRAMWRVHGKPGGATPGAVANPYSPADVLARLAEVSGDRAFADDFHARHIAGREAPDYARLLAAAGFVVRRARPGRPWMGELSLESAAGGARVGRLVAPGTPAYAAGMDRHDVILAIDEQSITSPDDVARANASKRPGESVSVTFRRRGGEQVDAKVTLVEDPALEVVTLESTGGRLSSTQQAFRDAWLSSRVRALASQNH